MATSSKSSSTLLDRLQRRTIAASGASLHESRDMVMPGYSDNQNNQRELNPSKDATAFTRSYDVKRETISSGPDIDHDKDGARDTSSRDIIGTTKVEIVQSDSTTNPKHVYVNISTKNNNTDVGIPAYFQIDFDQPYLHDAEKYYLTIAKATFPVTTIPLFEFVLNNYYIVLSCAGTFVQVFLKPLNINIFPDGKYFVFFYQQFLDSLNTALFEAFNEMKTTQPAFTGTNPPFVIFDKPSNRFSLIAENDVYSPDWGSATNAIINFDYSTFRLFNSFPGISNIQPSGLSVVTLNVENCGVLIPDGVNPLLTNNISNIYSNYDARINYKRGSIVFYNGLIYGAITDNVNVLPTVIATWQAQTATLANSSIYQAGVTYVQSQIVYYPTQNSVPFVSLKYPNLGNTPIPGVVTANQIYNPATTYSINQYVYYLGILYYSLQNANTGNTPSSSPTFWAISPWLPLPCGYPTVWSPLTTYEIGQNVYFPNIGGTIYTSTTNGNIAHAPSADLTGANWLINTSFNSINMIGEYSTLSQWQDIESIVIETGTLPIRYEVFAPPQGDIGTNVTTSGSQVPRPVLTDLDLIKTESGFDRSPVQYVPNGPYRMIDLLSKPILNRIDAYIQYKHKDLTFSDLIMLPGDYFAIKFLFIRNDALSLT